MIIQPISRPLLCHYYRRRAGSYEELIISRLAICGQLNSHRRSFNELDLSNSWCLSLFIKLIVGGKWEANWQHLRNVSALFIALW